MSDNAYKEYLTERSTMLEKVSHEGETLTVVFRNGGKRYAYEGVPRGDYYRLIEAESIGQKFREMFLENPYAPVGYRV